MTGPSPEDITAITNLANSTSLDEARDWLVENDCFTELAWLEAMLERSEREWFVTVMTALAHAKSLTTGIRLSIPEVEND